MSCRMSCRGGDPPMSCLRRAKKVTVFSFLGGGRRHTHIPKITLFHRYPLLTYFGHLMYTKCTPCLGSRTICGGRVEKNRPGQTPQKVELYSYSPSAVKKRPSGQPLGEAVLPRNARISRGKRGTDKKKVPCGLLIIIKEGHRCLPPPRGPKAVF